ncbi:MAG: 3-phosphoshikimate 1-carboxyvinyltransferase, partial [Acidimicrobiales bacterium]
SVDDGAGRDVTLTPGRPLAREWRVPGDPSQAAFFCVLGAIHRDARVDVIDVDGAPERTGFVAVLQRMGATVRMEPTASGVTFSASSSTLAATEVHANEIPSVDEVPALTVAAAAATGVTVFRSVGELRVKESDRLEGSRELAQALGCRSWIEGDDLFVEGLGSAARFEGFELSARLDHRMAMAAAVAATCGAGGVISGDDAVASSYPDFFADVASLT